MIYSIAIPSFLLQNKENINKITEFNLKSIILISFLFSTNLFAHTNVGLDPRPAASCKDRKFDTINYIIDKKVVENAQTLEISFKTFYGDCRNKEFKIRKFYQYSSINFFKEGMNLPWSYKPTYAIEYSNDNKIASVTIKMDKEVIFARNKKRFFTMELFTNSNANIKYTWIITATYNEEKDETNFSIVK
jgi:hypothetical protein